jgi:hypothetical protein
MTQGVEQLNEAISSLDIRGDAGVRLDAPLVRIFNNHMDRGGRFYARGTSWQNVRKDARRRILVDGNAIAELDYSSLHPTMLYSDVGATPPQDCYAIDGWPRELVKDALLTLINAANHRQAIGSITHKRVMPSYRCDELEAVAIAERLVADVKAAHRPIARFFHNDAGGRLMRRDSDLAGAVMGSLLKKGVVALPVHDSFLVSESQARTLEAAMLETAAQIGLKGVKVREKGKPDTHPPLHL